MHQEQAEGVPESGASSQVHDQGRGDDRVHDPGPCFLCCHLVVEILIIYLQTWTELGDNYNKLGL